MLPSAITSSTIIRPVLILELVSAPLQEKITIAMDIVTRNFNIIIINFQFVVGHWYGRQLPWLCEGWEFCVPVASLGRNFIVITAKLVQLSRITNVDGLYSLAPIAQMQMLPAGRISLICSQYISPDHVSYFSGLMILVNYVVTVWNGEPIESHSKSRPKFWFARVTFQF